MDNEKHIPVITCASYGGTGSGIITDLLKEVDIIENLDDYEFDFLFQPDGISDLEHALVDDWNRLKSGIYIYRFKKYIDELSKPNFKIKNIKSWKSFYSYAGWMTGYENFFNNKFKKTSYEYIDSLIGLNYEGFWHYFDYHLSPFSSFIRMIKRIYFKFFSKDRFDYSKSFKYPIYISDPEKSFYDETKKYLNKLAEILLKNKNKSILYLDQLVPPYNVNRYLNYFYDCKVIVVDRDPRDVYVENYREGWVPEDIDDFIKYFRLLHKYKPDNENTERVLRLRMENIIYNYDKVVDDIFNFLNIDKKHHNNKKKYFDPDISVKNIGKWKKWKNQNDMEKIHSELSEYCYDIC